MAGQVAEQMTDKLKIGMAVLLVLAGLVGFYMMSDRAMIWRLASLFGGLAAGAVLAGMSESGRRFFEFAKEARDETRKVAWPTRKESLQTAAAVFAFVLVMAAFLWISDKSLEYLLYDLILRWKK